MSQSHVYELINPCSKLAKKSEVLLSPPDTCNIITPYMAKQSALNELCANMSIPTDIAFYFMFEYCIVYWVVSI